MRTRHAGLLLAAAAVSLVAFTSIQLEPAWEGAGNFTADEAQCKAEASRMLYANHLHVSLLFDICMREKGWELIDRQR